MMSQHTELPPTVSPVAPPKKKTWLARRSPRTRALLGLGVIALFTIFAIFFAPKERDASNTTGDTVLPTATITNLISTLTLQHSASYHNTVTFTITQATQASSFSDDRKRQGVYTIRIYMRLQSSNTLQGPLAINYADLANLQFANGQTVPPKLVALSPAVLPNQTQEGYIDFPATTPVNLTSLVFHLGSSLSIPLGS